MLDREEAAARPLALSRKFGVSFPSGQARPDAGKVRTN
jgi:hypothetical protein